MKKIGLNTIKYEGLSIYDSNVLTISREKGISLIFSFWVPNTIDFATDHKGKLKLSKNILEKVKKLKNEEHILSWNIENDTWLNLNKTFNEPVLSYQRNAYLEWLRELILDIKKIDSSRPVIIDLQLNDKTLDRIEYMQDIGIATDLYGFLITDIDMLNLFISDPRSDKIPYIINEIDSESFLESMAELENRAVVLRNWQDQWENNKVSFDGLLDFKGRKKASYGKFIKRNSSNVAIEHAEMIRILVPSILLYPNTAVIYHAVMLQDNKWVYPDSSKYNEAFEWLLIKKDVYGNELAIKELGKGISKSIIVPENYNNYELVLIHSKNNTVSSVRTNLNTRLTSILDDSQ